MSTAVRFLILGSLRGGILILAVLLLRVLLRKLPKRYVCLLWTAVWLRLALPFAVRSRFGLLPWLSFLDRSGAARSQVAVIPSLSPEAAASSAPTSAAFAASMDWPLLIWIVGLVLLLLYAGIRFVLLKRKVREAIPLRGKLWLCDWVETPFLLGLFRPRIYLPSGVEEGDIPWITAHEESHLRHGDPWRKLSAFLLTAVYWFQPLAWVAFFLYCRDLELACDERTSRDFDADARSAYAAALLRASTPGRSVWAVPMGFGSAPVRRRIKAIQHPAKYGRWMLAAAAFFCVVVLFVFTVEPIRAAQAVTDPERSASEISSEAFLPDQPETNAPESSENAYSYVPADTVPLEFQGFLVIAPPNETIIIRDPYEYHLLRQGEASYVVIYDDVSDQTYAIGPFFSEEKAP